MLKSILRDLDISAIDAEFTRLVGAAGVVASTRIDEKSPIYSLIVGDGYRLALVAALNSVRGSSVDQVADRVSDAALAVIEDILGRLGRGELVPAKIGQLSSYISGAVGRELARTRRIKYPIAVRREGPLGQRLYLLIAVQGMDTEHALALICQDAPADCDRLRKQVLPAILDVASRRRIKGASELASEDTPTDPVILEEKADDVSWGRRGVNPFEELLRQFNRDAIRRAVDSLPEPQRTYAREYYLHERYSSQKEFGRAYRLKNPQYELKKIRESLSEALNHLRPRTQ